MDPNIIQYNNTRLSTQVLVKVMTEHGWLAVLLDTVLDDLT